MRTTETQKEASRILGNMASMAGYHGSTEDKSIIEKTLTDLRAALAQPAKLEPLSDERIMAIAKPFIRAVGSHWDNEDAIPDNGKIEEFARAIEAELTKGQQ